MSSGYDPRQYQALVDERLLTEHDYDSPDRQHVKGAEWAMLAQGPMEVGTELETPEDPHADLHVRIWLGQLHVRLTWDDAHLLLHVLLAQLIGPRSAAALMAVVDRLPHTVAEETVVNRILWRATSAWMHLWPQRLGGYDDAVWGCRAPEGVKALKPTPDRYFMSSELKPSEAYLREAKDAQLPPPPRRPPPPTSGGGGGNGPGPNRPRRAKVPKAA